MKMSSIVLLMIVSGWAGCSRPAAPPKLVEIRGDDFMKFDVTSFEVKPEQRVVVRLTNTGELPKEATAHNWVLLSKQADPAQFVSLGKEHPETDYIPFEQSYYVLAKTRLLGPAETDSVSFTAPRQPGSYDYICTFPEHYAAGMKGVMTVRP